MEAALVRGDPVPLHEQIRAQRRAALAGAVLGLLGLCGAAVWAVLVPSPDWRREAVVIGATSGAMYAVAHAPTGWCRWPIYPRRGWLPGAARGGEPGTHRHRRA
jgi:hypothetical protein